MIVQFSGVSKAFGSYDVLRDAAFQINPTEKVGLIGPNGAGKTTLLRIISGAYEPDSGTVIRKAGLQIGVLEQIPDFHETTSVVDEALHASDGLRRLESEMRQLEHRIADGASRDDLERYSNLQHQFEIGGGYSYRARTEAALLGLGFSKSALAKPCTSLSGGEKNRLALAKLLLSNADLLLLDEPTNHLDVRSIEWLEKFLTETEKTVIVVSHDRVFLDRVVRRIIEIRNAGVETYRGNYSEYLTERDDRLARQEKDWLLQKEWIEKQEEYIRRNIAGQKTKQAQSRRKLLARLKPVERPQSFAAAARFRFAAPVRSERAVLTAQHLAAGYGGTPIVSGVQMNVCRGERWAILGANGSGKTTLLRTLIGMQPAVEGDLTWNSNIETAYYAQQLETLEREATVIDEIRNVDPDASDGELRSYLAQFLFTGDDVFKKTAQLSGGEKSRLTLARIIYVAPQLLALDEPTNHLDIASREALESALIEYPGTILFVTHDRRLVQKLATHLIYIENGEPHTFDRLSAFEEWLADRGTAPVAPGQERERLSQARPGMSKNRKEQIEKAVTELEGRITALESETAELEACFQSPGAGVDWEAKHRRYAELKSTLEGLYQDLASHWEMIG